VEPVHRGRPRRPAEPQAGRLVDVGQRRAGHPGQDGQLPFRRGNGREGGHRSQPGQTIVARDPEELLLADAVVTPVRVRVQHEMRRHPQHEGRHRPACRHADQHPGQDMVRHQHVVRTPSQLYGTRPTLVAFRWRTWRQTR